MIRIEITLNIYFSLHLEKGSTIAKVSVIHRHICVHWIMTKLVAVTKVSGVSGGRNGE